MRFLYTYLFICAFALITEAQVPTPSISVSPSVLCSGRSATFTSITPTLPVSEYLWSVLPGSGVIYKSVNSNSVLEVSFTKPGRYVVSLLLDFGLPGISTKTLASNVNISAQASFNASLTSGTGFPNELILTNYSSNFSKNYWIFDNNFAAKDSAVNTVYYYSTAGDHQVSLVTIGSQACNDTSSYSFKLALESSMSLPNVFSPNGDGVNDYFKPTAEGLSSIHVRIYNRLGTLIRDWETINGFWDGTTTSAIACDAGVYFVTAEATGFDGKNYSLKSTLTLLR